MALQDLKNAAQAIKDQTKIFGNSHTIVGDLLLQILDIILTSDMITQSSGKDPGKVMSQKAVTTLINALNDAITSITKAVIVNNQDQGSENVYLQIRSSDHNIGRIGVDLYGNAFFEYLDPDQTATRWHILSKEFLAEVMGKTTITGLNKYIEKFAFNIASAQTLSNVGEIMYNSGSGTLELKMSNDVTLQIGQEHLRKVKNDSGVVITNGKLVYVSGGLGANALVKLATTEDQDAAQRTFGMATQDITVGGTGYITLLGDVNGLNTSGITEGAELWLGTSGNYTSTEPTGATPRVYIGRCLRSHATAGVVGVNVRPIPRMHKLSGVSGTPTNTGQIYRYNASTSCFELYDLNLLATKDDVAQVVADEKAIFPAIAYNKRVLADGGTVVSKQAVIDGYKTMIDLLPNTKLMFCPNTGIKTRTIGIYNYLTKAYDMGIGGVDLSQYTEVNQPYLSGNIAPNEKISLKANLNSTAKTIAFAGIPFLSTDSFDIFLVVKPNKIADNQVINISSSAYVKLNSSGITLYNGISNILSTSSISEVGKTNIVEFKYSNGTGLIKVNGIPATTTVVNGALTLDRITTNFDGNIYYTQIFNKCLSEIESQNIYAYLRSQYTEIEGVNIGNQYWSTSNYEGVVTGNGTVIPEVQSASTSVSPNLITGGDFENGLFGVKVDEDGVISTWDLNTSNPISGIQDGRLVITQVGSNINRPFFNWSISNLVLNKYYRIAFDYKVNSGTCILSNIYNGSGLELLNQTLSGTGTFAYIIQCKAILSFCNLYFNGNNLFDVQIDNISLKEVGWADLTTPAWCYYNNDPVLGSIYGKLYNWYAVKEIAKNPPKGWRVPTKGDIKQLIDYLGGSIIAGGKVKKESLTYWNTPNSGATNECGLSVIGSGWRKSNGIFETLKMFWSIWNFTNTTTLTIGVTYNKTTFEELDNNPLFGISVRLMKNSPVGDQIQNISTGVFTTNIALGTANKDLSIPFGYEVKAINVITTTAITDFKCDLLNTAGALQQNLVIGKSAIAKVPIKYGVFADINIQYTDPILRFNCTGNGGGGMEITVVINKIL
jgi:uncharacterized protein (TIGR02145 family)